MQGAAVGWRTATAHEEGSCSALGMVGVRSKEVVAAVAADMVV
jgi:hypothetical protein